MRRLLLISTLLLCLSCRNDMSEVNEIFAEAEADVERIENIDIIYSDSAEAKLRITAPVHLRYFELGDQIDEFQEGVRLEFLDGDRLSAWLTADWAKRSSKYKGTEMKGRVTLVNKLGQKLETTKMYWDENKGLLHSREFVRLTDGEEVMHGFGFQTDEEFKRFELTSAEAEVEVDF